MSTNRKNHWIAHYYDGGSHDKVYIACVRKAGDSFIVVGKWGRRGKRLSEQAKGSYNNFDIAASRAQDLFGEKLRKGYVNIESSAYHGPVTEASVSEYLEPMGAPGAKAAPAEPEEFVVTCVDNESISDRFDEGVEYLARTTAKPTVIEVQDVFGEWNKIAKFSSRFKRAEGVPA